jgi:hypothetical protein
VAAAGDSQPRRVGQTLRDEIPGVRGDIVDLTTVRVFHVEVGVYLK